MESLSFVAPVAYTIDWLIFFSDKSKALGIGIVSCAGVVLGSGGAGHAQLPLGGFATRGHRQPPVGAALMGVGGVTGTGLHHRPGAVGRVDAEPDQFHRRWPASSPARWRGEVPVLARRARHDGVIRRRPGPTRPTRAPLRRPAPPLRRRCGLRAACARAAWRWSAWAAWARGRRGAGAAASARWRWSTRPRGRVNINRRCRRWADAGHGQGRARERIADIHHPGCACTWSRSSRCGELAGAAAAAGRRRDRCLRPVARQVGEMARGRWPRFAVGRGGRGRRQSGERRPSKWPTSPTPRTTRCSIAAPAPAQAWRAAPGAMACAACSRASRRTAEAARRDLRAW